MVSQHAVLGKGLQALNIDCSDQQLEQLLAYVALLQKWNHAYNLTAIRDPEQMLTHHILDSLSVSAHVQGKHILDAGAGAGLPGIPLAILQQEKHFTLLDSNGKKTRFMQQAVLELQLKNVEVIKFRLEEYRPARSFDTVMSRAFTSINAFIQRSSKVCSQDTHILCMKGQYPAEELQAFAEMTDKNAELQAVHKLQVPGIDAERHLVCFKWVCL